METGAGGKLGKSANAARGKGKGEGSSSKAVDDDAVMKPVYPPMKSSDGVISADGKQKTKRNVDFRRISVPPHRFSPLKEQWMSIYEPVTKQMKIDIRMNLKNKSVRQIQVRFETSKQKELIQSLCLGPQVELKTGKETEDIGALQKCADFVHAFMLGFEVRDAIALLRLDNLYLETFEIKDVKTLKGEHLSRAIGRLAG